MRISEKITYSFIMISAIIFGSFLIWKIQAKKADLLSRESTIASENKSLASPMLNGGGNTAIEVTSTPFLDIGAALERRRQRNNPFAKGNANTNNAGATDNPSASSGQDPSAELMATSLPTTNNSQPVADSNKNLNTNTNRNNNSNANNITNNNLNNNVNSNNNQNNSNSFSFAVLGDTQEFEQGKDSKYLKKAVRGIEKSEVGLVIAIGDLVSSCDANKCLNKLTAWKGIIGSLFSKTYPIMGNHDRTAGANSDKIWQDFFDLPKNGPEGYSELTYSFDYQNSHFIALNSERPDEYIINKTQRDWLEQDLKNTKQQNIFVFFHEPAWPTSSKIGESLDMNKGERDALWEILKNYRVEAVFSGHEHIYSRNTIDGIKQFIVGNTDSFDHNKPKEGAVEASYVGRHYAIVEVLGENITLKAYSLDGKVIDTATIGQ